MLSEIPKIDNLLKEPAIVRLEGNFSRKIIVDAIREEVAKLRKSILDDAFQSPIDFNIHDFVDSIVQSIKTKGKNNLRRAVNCTGVVIHTNLGRSPLASRAIEAIGETASNYSNLEIDINSGERGSRYSHIESILCKLTGAEAAMAVNNNAAAVVLCLSALAKNKEVIVSRGQLVEIGGSFRIPEVMEQSGAKLVEVGATNKTHLRDYEKAIGEDTALLLKVHTSNYRICGFTSEVSIEQLNEIGSKHNIPVMEDIGSGVFINLEKYGLTHEPTVKESIDLGADIVTFSGDKLLGGPQAGIIVGKKAYIDIIKKHPLTRAVRIDKLSLAALEATLYLYMDEEQAIKEIPVLQMLTASLDSIRRKAEMLLSRINNSIIERIDINIEESFSTVGGGSMPLELIPTHVISINPKETSVDQLDQSLRSYHSPIFTRTSKGKLIIDLRTVQEDEIDIISEALNVILGSNKEGGNNA